MALTRPTLAVSPHRNKMQRKAPIDAEAHRNNDENVAYISSINEPLNMFELVGSCELIYPTSSCGKGLNSFSE